MRKEYDFSQGKRGAVLPLPGKTRATNMLDDDDVIEAFPGCAEAHSLPRHNLPHLYKYTTADVAKKVIRTQAFRWSSPLLFNDPFDHQTGFVFTYTGKELALAMEQISESAIFGDDPFSPRYTTKYGDALRQMRAIRHRLPRAEVVAQTHEASAEIADEFLRNCERLNQQATSFLTHSRVLCLTETGDNVVMWSHYANAHTGVVFKLRRLEARDHLFLAARDVKYTDEPLSYLTLSEHLDNLVGFAYHDPAPLMMDIAYRKHSDWAYEREWRVHIPLLDEPTGDAFSYNSEPKELFEAIYLGCRMTPMMAVEMAQLVREHLPETQIYQARKGRDRVRLEFERLS